MLTGNPIILRILWYFNNYLVDNNLNSLLLMLRCYHNYSFSLYYRQHYLCCCQCQIACTFPVRVHQASKIQSSSENLLHKKPQADKSLKQIIGSRQSKGQKQPRLLPEGTGLQLSTLAAQEQEQQGEWQARWEVFQNEIYSPAI